MNISNMNEPLIKKLLEQYEKKQIRQKARYDERKSDTDFINMNRVKSKDYYANNKDKKREQYVKDKDFIKARNQFYYYRKNNKVDYFKEKFVDQVELLKSRNVIL